MSKLGYGGQQIIFDDVGQCLPVSSVVAFENGQIDWPFFGLSEAAIAEVLAKSSHLSSALKG